MEQRPDGRTDQPPQNSQTGHVRPSRARTSARAYVACINSFATEIEEDPVEAFAGHHGPDEVRRADWGPPPGGRRQARGGRVPLARTSDRVAGFSLRE